MRFLILHDHPLIEAAITQALLLEYPLADIETPATLTDAVALIADAPADLLLIDLFSHAPGMPGPVAALCALLEARPDQRVCVVSDSDQADSVQLALTLGARGFIPKSVSPAQLVSAVRVMLSGGCFFLQALTPAVQMLQADSTNAAAGAPPMRITRRQSEIIELLLVGHPNKGIARDLGIALQTVKAHLTTLMAVLQVENRTQLALAVARFDQEHPHWRPRALPDAPTAWEARRAAAVPEGWPDRDIRTP